MVPRSVSCQLGPGSIKPSLLFLAALIALWARLSTARGLDGNRMDTGWWKPREITRESLGLPKTLGRADAVTVAIKSATYFGAYHREVKGCLHTDGEPLQCVFINATRRPAPEADAVWYHIPNVCRGAYITSREASTYYSCLDDVNYMDKFDIEMTYRKCSHVQVPYFPDIDSDIQDRLFADPETFENKLDNVAYINSNCGALNGRDNIVSELMALNQLPVDAWGRCQRNVEAANQPFDKVRVFRKYKFCIAMENSNTLDYVTEKVWQGLESGCLPIYWGAQNIKDYVPLASSIIDYRDYGTPEKLMAHLVRLSKDKKAYQATQQWRYLPLDRLSRGFRKLVLTQGSAAVNTQCRVCQILMTQRLSPVNLTRTHCLRNTTWMNARRMGASSWGPGTDQLLKQPHAHRWSPSGVWDPFHQAPLNKPRKAPDTLQFANWLP